MRSTGGYAGWTDDDLLLIPYDRFVQAIRVASDEKQSQSQAELLNAAFVGWQVAGAVGGSKKLGSFKRYAQQLGVMPKPKSKPLTAEQVEAARQRTTGLAEKVVTAFGKGR